MAEEDPWQRDRKRDRDGRARGYEVGAGKRRVWSSRGMEIHRYVFQPQSCRSRRAAKRMRGKRGRPEGVEGARDERRRRYRTGCERKNGEMGGRLTEEGGEAPTTAGSGGDDSSSKC